MFRKQRSHTIQLLAKSIVSSKTNDWRMNMGVSNVQNNGNRSDGNCPPRSISNQRFLLCTQPSSVDRCSPTSWLFRKFHIC